MYANPGRLGGPSLEDSGPGTEKTAVGEKTPSNDLGQDSSTHANLAALELSFFDALPCPVAFFSDTGTLMAANQGWSQFAADHALPDPQDSSDSSYLDLCEARAVESPVARRLARTLRAELGMHHASSITDFPVNRVERFELRVSPIEKPFSGIIVMVVVSPLSRRAHLDSLQLLAGGMAHDFNNLLTGILGYADLALFGVSADAPAHKHIEQIRVGGQRASALAQKLLSYSGKGPLMLRSVDLSDLVSKTVDLIREDLSESCAVSCELASELPAIQGDVEQLRNVLAELLTNAQAALSGGGKIVVRTGAMSCDAAYLSQCFLGDETVPGKYAYLEVEDNGSGVPAHLKERIFEPFFSGANRGRGLGLAVVLGLVRRHAGTIRLTSLEGKGSVFRLHFPTGQYASA